MIAPSKRSIRLATMVAAGLAATAAIAPAIVVGQSSGTWTNTAGGTWGVAGNWQGSTIASGTGASANFSTLNISGAKTVALDAAYTLGSLSFGDTTTSSSGSWVISNGGNAANTLTLNAGVGTPAITVSGMGSGSTTISAVISGTQGLAVNTLGDANAGLLVLSGSNNYTGNTAINSGTLHFSAASAYASLSGTFTVTNAALLFTTAANPSYFNLPIVAAGSEITLGRAAGSGFTAFGGAITGTAGVSLVGQVGMGGASTYSGPTTIGPSVNVFVYGNATGSGGSPITGAFGTGTVTLAGGSVRTFGSASANMVINNIVRVTADTTFNTGGSASYAVVFAGPMTLVGGTRTLTTQDGTGNWIAFNGSIGDDGNGYGLVKAGNRLLVLGGSNSYSGATTLNSGTLRLDNQHALRNSTFSHSGTGSLLFSSVVAANAFTFGGLASSSTAATLTLSSTAGTAITLTVGGNNASTSYAGSLTGAGALVKTGGGALTLSGSNTYAGATTVSQGTLVVNGDQSAANGAFSVAGGATLMGSGTIGGAATIFGLHSPGTSPGVQTFVSNLSYSGGASSVLWELAANTATNSPVAYDQIVVGGNLDFAGLTVLSLSFDSAGSSVNWSDAFWASSRAWTVYSVAGTTFNFGNLSLSGSPTSWLDSQSVSLVTARPGAAFSISQDGSNVQVVYAVVPEPSTWAGAVIGIAAVGMAMRNRRRREIVPRHAPDEPPKQPGS